ncbi:unnamed protein product [Brachionus calyciflorus]|uniref:Uncharacterized protein n=1 Tax=Brachionus calyciflorus TaxID=104777 RepID=A0A814AL86_9BILA|nr:unnamed protein product [Brachionus calyciflorus]
MIESYYSIKEDVSTLRAQGKTFQEILSILHQIYPNSTNTLTIKYVKDILFRTAKKERQNSRIGCDMRKVPKVQNCRILNSNPQVEKYLGTLLYYPIESIVGQDISGLKFGQDITVNISFACKRKKTLLNCQIEDLSEKLAKPGFFMKIQNKEPNAVRQVISLQPNDNVEISDRNNNAPLISNDSNRNERYITSEPSNILTQPNSDFFSSEELNVTLVAEVFMIESSNSNNETIIDNPITSRTQNSDS